MLITDPSQVDEEVDASQGEASTGIDPTSSQDQGAAGGATCSNCQHALGEKNTTVCPHCGYYPSLGICIELDQTWERLAAGPSVEPSEQTQQSKPKVNVDELLKLVPPWGWKLIGCNAAILLLSIFARIVVPSGFPRTLWSVTQLFAGITTFLTCHGIAYLISIADDASMNMLDIVLRPFRLWKDVLRELPHRFRLVASGSCGLTAAFGSLVIIGALQYEVLLDWGIKAPPQRNLMGAILAQAREVEGDENGLEEAVEDFAGTGEDVAADMLAAKPVEKNVRVDCVIIGYTVDRRNPDAVSAVLIAREFYGQLKFVGRLSDGLDDRIRQRLLEELAELPRDRPFVAVPPHFTATWVQPEVLCRVKCIRETPTGNLVEMEFDQMLTSVD